MLSLQHTSRTKLILIDEFSTMLIDTTARPTESHSSGHGFTNTKDLQTEDTESLYLTNDTEGK